MTKFFKVNCDVLYTIILIFGTYFLLLEWIRKNRFLVLKNQTKNQINQTDMICLLTM